MEKIIYIIVVVFVILLLKSICKKRVSCDDCARSKDYANTLANVSWGKWRYCLLHNSTNEYGSKIVCKNYVVSREYYNLGNAAMRKNDYEEAIRLYFIAIDVNNFASSAHANLAHVYSITERLDSAVYHINIALNSAPNNKEIINLYHIINKKVKSTEDSNDRD